ncbi:hypothetical protein [Caldimonas brevitalea]|uniref:Uncharacterized protein n=1 Tax=Caldimonas brevitalea TaxID=413882 RepID=A0A0G3BN78_9BURK|nr:hypothetical protein [Caldimonas brevitalea]AKJ28801.1 hypothetical protein AAW51_2110 [Caldimonas brevitalea]
MSTDREMLELAAKAAGAHSTLKAFKDGIWVQWSPNLRGFTRWDPLTDDGARYRLLSKLRGRIDFEICVVRIGNHVCVCWPEDEPDEARAVVRAAAEIGRAMG